MQARTTGYGSRFGVEARIAWLSVRTVLDHQTNPPNDVAHQRLTFRVYPLWKNLGRIFTGFLWGVSPNLLGE